MELRDYQADLCARLIERLTHSNRVLGVLPTGAGKSYVILTLMAWAEAQGKTACVVSPRLEILIGIAQKAGSNATTPAKLQAEHLWTPVRLRNVCRKGKAPAYDVMIVDEGHHAVAETHQLLDVYFYGAKVIGVTATAFRGTPSGTLALRDYWGEPVVGLSYPEAARRGVIRVPRFAVFPLLDDDVIGIASNGDFRVSGASGLTAAMTTASRREALADLVKEMREVDPRPAMVSVPSTEVLEALLNDLAERGVHAEGITQRTRPKERLAIFEQLRRGEIVLVQINVVTEGVDIPELRVWIDASPTMSPVKWMQTAGRFMRPGAEGTALCVCRNLERHAYLLDGLVPRATIAQAQEAFGGQPSARNAARHLGLERLGKFKAIPLPLAGGVTTAGYSLFAWDTEKQRKTEYFAIVSPTTPNMIFAARQNAVVDDPAKPGETKTEWGKWRLTKPPEDFEGFVSSRKSVPLSDKQRKWWTEAARDFGLAPVPPEEARIFQVLPVLRDLRRYDGLREVR